MMSNSHAVCSDIYSYYLSLVLPYHERTKGSPNRIKHQQQMGQWSTDEYRQKEMGTARSYVLQSK